MDLRTRYLGLARLAAVVVPLVVAATVGALRDSITAATAVLVLVLVVVAFGAVGDRVSGLLAAVSSGIWFDFFLTEPYYRFAVDDPDDIEAVVLLVLVGGAVTELALWGLRQQARASRRSGYLDGVLETAEESASAAGTAAEAIRRVTDRITAVLGVDRCRYLPDTAPWHGAPILERDGSVRRGDLVLEVDKDGLPTDEEICVVVGGAADRRGHLRISAASRVARPTLEERRVAVLLADHIPAPAAPDASR